jgi:hypothetical protein
MFKKIGGLLVTLLGGALLVYSATRTLHFIQMTLPEDSKILAYFGLAALDGGLVAWLLSYLYGSRGGWQRAISMLMVVVDAVGVIAMFTLDTLYSAGMAGMTEGLTASQIHNAILALSGIIGLNIIATIAHHLTDPDKLREQAEEEAFSKVEDATLKQIQTNADQLAAQLAPTLAADWMNQTKARYMSYIGTGKIPTIDATAQDVTPKASGLFMPVLAEDKPKADGLNFSALLGGWLAGAKANGRTYEQTAMFNQPTKADGESFTETAPK